MTDYIVFIPLEDNKPDIESGLFGAYNDEEWDRIRPYEKVDNYTTSYTFHSLKEAKDFMEEIKNKDLDFSPNIS